MKLNLLLREINFIKNWIKFVTSMLTKIHSSCFHEICLAFENKAGIHCTIFLQSSSQRHTRKKRHRTKFITSNPAKRTSLIKNTCVRLDFNYSSTVWASPQGSVFIQPYTAWSAHGCEWLWQRTYIVWEFISTIISERFYYLCWGTQKQYFCW